MFFLFIFVTLLVLAIHTSKIGIEIENLKLDTEQPKGKKINDDSKIYVYLLVFQKIKVFKKDIKKIKFQDNNIDIKIFKNKNFLIDYKELIKNIDIKQIDLNIQLSTQDAAVTAILTGAISAGVGIILRKPKYEVKPIFSNKNFLKIKLDCIFSLYLMQYIYKLIFYKIKNFGKVFLNKKVEV